MIATQKCNKIQNFLVVTKTEDWCKSVHEIILCMKDQTNNYNDKDETPLTGVQIHSHMELVVNSVPELENTQTTIDQLKKWGTNLTMAQHFTSLENAAKRHDLKTHKACCHCACTK